MLALRAALGASAAGCLPVHPFGNGMQAAYAPYRAALVRTNGKSQAEAEAEEATTKAQLPLKILTIKDPR